MVYFIMAASLLFFLYGAEEARSEQRWNQYELVRTLPGYTRYRMGKFVYWLLLTSAFYLIFFTAVSLYIVGTHGGGSAEKITQALVYTWLCWWFPFFLTVVLGYVIYSLLSSLYSYVLIVLVWFLIMPYNTMAFGEFLPLEVSGWLVIGDPNIEQIFGIYDMESQQINIGFYIQRLAALLLTVGIYAAVVWKGLTRKIAYIVMAAALTLPVVSSHVPYLSGGDPVLVYQAAAPLNEEELKYAIDNVEIRLEHGRSNHDLSYVYEVDIKAEVDVITLALLDDFQVVEARFGDLLIPVSQQEGQLKLKLPAAEGRLMLSLVTHTYASVGPSFFELPSALPWYPMHPLEAADPYHHGLKETYRLDLKGLDHKLVWTNLSALGDGMWEGKAYGPTIIYGAYKKAGEIISPAFKDRRSVERGHNELARLVEEAKERLGAGAELPVRGYMITTMQQFTANPDEFFVYQDERLLQSESLLNVMFLRGSETGGSGMKDTRLFAALYFGNMKNPSTDIYYKSIFGEDVVKRIRTVYMELPEQEKEQMLRMWYQQTGGLLTPERIMKDLEGKTNAGG
ncbi:hypothetical protein E6C60_0339 [Paenibacillus algicola]|uniref:Uncharacterized protein n=2 Tax=Paenibacillus TaxID=44249 RepID=A0A4P8XG44_9BACL|nr:hypothetical protein [Paenibacillus algicola]QCT01063.1 hypothetical protein E6C60_0339 [Paenibacillus algicola]